MSSFTGDRQFQQRPHTHTHTATLSSSPNSQGDSEQPGKVRMGSSKPRDCQHQSPRQTRPSEAKRTPAHTTLLDRCQTLWCSEGLYIPPFLPHRKRDLDLDSQDVMPLVDWGWHQASELLRVGASPVTLLHPSHSEEPSPARPPPPFCTKPIARRPAPLEGRQAALPTPTTGSAVSPPDQREGSSGWITGPWFPGQEHAGHGRKVSWP